MESDELNDGEAKQLGRLGLNEPSISVVCEGDDLHLK